MNITDNKTKQMMLWSYLGIIIPFGIINYNQNIYSTISSEKHLNWNLMRGNMLHICIRIGHMI